MWWDKESMIDDRTKLRFNLPYQNYTESYYAKPATDLYTDSRRVPGSNASNVQPLSSAKAAISMLSICSDQRSYDRPCDQLVLQRGVLPNLHNALHPRALMLYRPRIILCAMYARFLQLPRKPVNVNVKKAWIGLAVRGTVSQCYWDAVYLSQFVFVQESSEVFQ